LQRPNSVTQPDLSGFCHVVLNVTYNVLLIQIFFFASSSSSVCVLCTNWPQKQAKKPILKQKTKLEHETIQKTNREKSSQMSRGEKKSVASSHFPSKRSFVNGHLVFPSFPLSCCSVLFSHSKLEGKLAFSQKKDKVLGFFIIMNLTHPFWTSHVVESYTQCSHAHFYVNQDCFIFPFYVFLWVYSQFELCFYYIAVFVVVGVVPLRGPFEHYQFLLLR
jgi:hypothetical protein